MADDNVILDSYFGDVNNSFYAGPNGADFHIREVFGNLREMLDATINDSTVLIGDYFLVNYGNQNSPSDGSKNPNGLSYNRNKGIDAVDGEVLDIQITTTSPSVQTKRKTDIPDGDIGDICFSTTSNTWWFIDSEYTGSSAQPQWVICNTFILDVSIFTSPSGYYNATLWRRKETEITEEGIVNPFDYYELMFQSVSAMPEIDVTTHTITPSSSPTVSISGPVENKVIDFGLPSAWGFTVGNVSTIGASSSPTVSMTTSGSNKQLNFSLPTAWGVTIGGVTTTLPSSDPTVTISQNGDNKQLNFQLPKAWDITATVTPTAGAASVSVTGTSATKTFAFQLPVVDATQVNPNLVYNPWFTVNTRGFEQYRGIECGYISVDSIVYNYITDVPGKIHWITGEDNNEDYTMDSWCAKNNIFKDTITNYKTFRWGTGQYVNSLIVEIDNQHIVKLTNTSSIHPVGIRSYLDCPDILSNKTVTLSIEYKVSENGQWEKAYCTGQLKNQSDPSASAGTSYANCSIPIQYSYNDGDGFTRTSFDIAKIITFKPSSSAPWQVYVLLRTPPKTFGSDQNPSIYFKKVKVEIGGYSTLDYDTEPNYYEEYNKCVHRYTTSPSNEDDDYARMSIDSASVFTLTSDKVSSLYEIGLTYLDQSETIAYNARAGAGENGSILNFDNESIALYNDNRVPMVCATFAQLMLAGIPYEQSRINTGEKSNGQLIGGTNIPWVGKSCFDIYSPVLKNYWGRYQTTEQLYSSSFAKLLYDANLLHEIKNEDDLNMIRPGDLLFYNAITQEGEPHNNWNENETYSQGWRVTYNNKRYQSLQNDNIGHTPPSQNDDWWQRISPTTVNEFNIPWNDTYSWSKDFIVLYDNKLYKSKVDNNVNHTPNGGTNDSYWRILIPNYRRWGAMQHVELFLGWLSTTDSIKALCLSTNASAKDEYFAWTNANTYNKGNVVWYPSIGQRLYKSKVDNNTNHTPTGGTNDSYWEDFTIQGIQFRSIDRGKILTSPTSRLHWYARLSAGAGGHVYPMNDSQALKESYDGELTINLPYTWSSVSSTPNWKYISVNDPSKVKKNRVYTIVIEAESNNPDAPIFWKVAGHSQGGSISVLNSFTHIDCTNQLFKINSNTYTGVLNLDKNSTFASFTGFAISPVVTSGSSYTATLKHVWIYDKIVAP